MKPTTPVLLLAAALLAGGCTTKLTKRHARPWAADALTLSDANGRTSLSLTALEIEEESVRKSLFELDGRGQEAYLTELGRRVQDPSALVAGARAELTPLPRTSGRIDLSKPKRRLVAGLVHVPFTEETDKKVVYHPADRVVWSEVELEIAGDQPFMIVGYDKVNTGYETVDLGKLTRSASFSLTGNAEGTASLGQARSKVTDTLGSTRGTSTGLTGTIGASATGGETLTEEVQLRKRYVSLAVLLDGGGKRLKLVREGVDGIDLTGAVTVDVQLEASCTSTSQVFTLGEKKLPDGSSGIGIERKMKVVPAVHTLQISGSSTSVIRNVERRGHTLREGDDKVAFQRSKTEGARVDIELERHYAYYIELKATSGAEVLHFKSPTVPLQEATFATYDDAVRVRNWILANSKTLDAFKGVTGGYELLTSKEKTIEPPADELSIVIRERPLSHDSSPPHCVKAAPPAAGGPGPSGPTPSPSVKNP